MCRSFSLTRIFECSKFIFNIVIILLIVRVVAPLNVSDVSGPNRPTSCSLRFTRQKVLIQGIENPEDFVKRTTDKYGNVKHKPSNIVVEEHRVRAKIHLQARSRTCRDLPTTNMNYTKSHIDALNPPRIIMCCYAESLIQNNSQRFGVQSSIEQSNNKPINILRNGEVKNKKILSGVTARIPSTVPYTKNVVLSRKEKNISLFANEEENPLRNILFNNIESSGLSNFEGDKPLSLFYNLKEEYHKPSERDDKLGFAARFGRSMKSMENKRSLKDTLKQVNNKMDIQYRRTRRKEFMPDSKTHNHTIKDMVVEIPNWDENYGIRKLSTTNTKDEMSSTTFLSFFDDYEVREIANNKLDKPRALFAPYELKKKIHKSSKENKKSQISPSCHRKSKKILNYDTIPVELEKRSASIGIESDMGFANEQEEFDRRYDHLDMASPLSLSHQYGEKSAEFSQETNKSEARVQNEKSAKAPRNNKLVPSIDYQKNVKKDSTNTNKKKNSRSENPSEKKESKLSKSTDTMNNTTKGKIQMEKQSNNKAWNFTMPPVFAKYIAFVSSFYDPLFGVDAMADNNQSTLIREGNDQTHSLNVSQEELGKKKSVTNSHTSPFNGRKLIRISMENSFPNSTGDDLSNSTNNFVNSMETFLTNSMEMFGANSKKILFTNLSKLFSTNSTDIGHAVLRGSSFLNSTRNSDRISVNKHFPMPAKNARIRMEETDGPLYAETGPKILAATISPTTRQTPRNIHCKSMDPLASKDCANYSISMDDKNNEQGLKIGKHISEISNFALAENARKLSSSKESIIKIITNSPNDLVKNSSVATSSKTEKFSDKTTVNFTIIDPNCNPANNNSADQSSIIVEIMVPTSTYPTLRRYSRNDTVKVQHRRNNDGKARPTKNSLNDSRSPNAGKKVRAGMMRRKNRIRIEGKHPVGVNSPMQSGKNSWRKNNGSAASNRTRLLNVDVEPIAGGSGKSTAIPISRELFNFSSSKALPDSISSSISSTVAWREIHLSSTFPPVDTNIHIPRINDKPTYTMSDVNSSKRLIELSSTESGHSDLREKMKIDTSTSTFSIGDSFSKETNDSYSTHSKVESTISTPSSKTDKDLKLTDLFTMFTVVTNSMKPDNKSRQDQVTKIEETSASTLTSQSSTLLYDEFISVDPLRAKKKHNLTIANNLATGDIGRNEENSSQPVAENTKNEDITNMSTTSLKIENLSSTRLSSPIGESRQELDGLTTIKIVNNIVTDESSTFSYDQSTFTGFSVNDEIVPSKQPKNTIGESSPVTMNEILIEGQNNTVTTLDGAFARDGRQAFLHGESTNNQTNMTSVTEETQKYSSTTERRISPKYSTIFPHSSRETDGTEPAERSSQFE